MNKFLLDISPMIFPLKLHLRNTIIPSTLNSEHLQIIESVDNIEPGIDTDIDTKNLKILSALTMTVPPIKYNFPYTEQLNTMQPEIEKIPYVYIVLVITTNKTYQRTGRISISIKSLDQLKYDIQISAHYASRIKLSCTKLKKSSIHSQRKKLKYRKNTRDPKNWEIAAAFGPLKRNYVSTIVEFIKIYRSITDKVAALDALSLYMKDVTLFIDKMSIFYVPDKIKIIYQ